MSFPLLLVSDFRSLFSGNTNGKGQTKTAAVDPSTGKLKSESWVSKVPIVDEDYIHHLEGKVGLGISPITTRNKCLFGVIDVDLYNGNAAAYLDTVYSFNLPLVPFYSKSSGLHLYLFFVDETPASEVIDLLQGFRSVLGLPADTEVFPKQRSIPADGLGNWINLPYFDAENMDNKRKLIARDGTLVDLESGIEFCKKSRKSLEEYTVVLDNLPLSDAPPCLQMIFMQRDTAYRNEYLFSLARYYKAKTGDNFEFEVVEANSMLKRPLEINEINKSVIMAHKKKDYSYKCGSPPLSTICNKDICRKRTFGIGNDFISDLSYEDFIQYKSDPPWYEWVINGQPLQFFNEADIINQQKFRELCFRKLYQLPYKLRDTVWNAIVNNALKNAIVKEVALEDDISSGRMLMEYVSEFLTGRVMAESKQQIIIDRVFYDEEKDSYIFRAVALIEYIVNTKGFKAFSSAEIQSRLKNLGGEPTRYYISVNNKSARVWSMPKASIERYKITGISDVLINFLDKEAEGDKF